MLTHLVELADTQRLNRSRLLVVHADLCRVEWPGTRELAQTEAAAYGLRFGGSGVSSATGWSRSRSAASFPRLPHDSVRLNRSLARFTN